MADQELDALAPPCLNLVSAFLAMEPTDHLIALVRVCSEGKVTEKVQGFIWNHCLSRNDGKLHAPYLKNFLKKLIGEVELSHSDVLDELYELYAHLMTSLKDDNLVKMNARVCKWISFLFPDGYIELSSCPKSRQLMIPLQCSLNMLEGDTGCSVWPSSLYLSECILSFPELFSNRSCFEVGAGVGLAGICLAHVKASEVILSDGGMSTLANMKRNLELNHLRVETDVLKTIREPNKVKCICLSWESATDKELQKYKPDIILGADVIYDPLYLPHLVRVLAILLNQVESCSHDLSGDGRDLLLDSCSVGDNENFCSEGHRVDVLPGKVLKASACGGLGNGPIAIIASVIRNVDTFNNFVALVDQANLNITDVTERLKPINLLPYMQSYNRSTIRLFILSCKE